MLCIRRGNVTIRKKVNKNIEGGGMETTGLGGVTGEKLVRSGNGKRQILAHHHRILELPSEDRPHVATVQ